MTICHPYVIGIKHLAPGFGLKTALKLLKKHHSLKNLLNAAAVRSTVGRQYVQDALTKYADHLRRNYEVLSLRDLNVPIQEEWLHEREANNDAENLATVIKLLGWSHDLNKKCGAHSNG